MKNLLVAFFCPVAIPAALSAQTQVVGPLGISNLNRVIYAASAPTSCSYNSVNYTTALDCANAQAHQLADAAAGPYTVVLAGGVNPTCVGNQNIPGHQPINWVGEGSGEFGGGSSVQAVCSMTTAVITYPYLSTTINSGFWYNVVQRDFSVDANGLAPRCFDLSAMEHPTLQNLGCTGVSENVTTSWARMGDNKVKLPTAFPRTPTPTPARTEA